MLNKPILTILVTALTIALLIIPVYAATRSPPYSNQSLYPTSMISVSYHHMIHVIHLEE